ncbi:MAG TPA: alpha-ketoglutarate-dependent dioxygenase AlkB [Polyangiaceae bacterium]
MQPRLALHPLLEQTIELARGGWVVHQPSWLDRATAHTLFQRLLGEIAWQRGSIQLFGKQVLEPRLIAWAGEMPYRYSGRTLAPATRPACLNQVWLLAETFAGVSFNHVLMNRYRTGDDSMGWHADTEPELGQNPPVLSLSLGATRRFLMKPKRHLPAEATREWRLTDGSVLFMGGSTQHHYRHSVPRQRGVAGERLNLTFRRVLCPPGAAVPDAGAH